MENASKEPVYVTKDLMVLIVEEKLVQITVTITENATISQELVYVINNSGEEIAPKKDVLTTAQVMDNVWTEHVSVTSGTEEKAVPLELVSWTADLTENVIMGSVNVSLDSLDLLVIVENA